MPKDVALLILRLSGFGLALAHGWGKVSLLAAGNFDNFISGVGQLGFPMPGAFAWAAALAEFAGGLAIAFGIGTRIAASFSGFTMFTAAFFQHKLLRHLSVWVGVSSFPDDVVRSWGDPERAALYLLIFVSLVVMGGGRFSVDRLMRGRKRS